MATLPRFDEKSGNLDDAKQTYNDYCDNRRPEKEEDDRKVSAIWPLRTEIASTDIRD